MPKACKLEETSSNAPTGQSQKRDASQPVAQGLPVRPSPRIKNPQAPTIRFFDGGVECDVDGRPLYGADDETRVSIPPCGVKVEKTTAQNTNCSTNNKDETEENTKMEYGGDLVELQHYQENMWNEFSAEGKQQALNSKQVGNRVGLHPRN
jgi:hypothetical protein